MRGYLMRQNFAAATRAGYHHFVPSDDAVEESAGDQVAEGEEGSLVHVAAPTTVIRDTIAKLESR